nr:type II toxin-antitoxin system RelE/ParE family toxin [Desulfonatronospira thiodismutans]
MENWPVGILADYARLVELLIEFGPSLRMPHSRGMGGGLFELRPRGREGIGRALYCFVVGQKVIIFLAFVKKAQQTPEHELKIARKRMKDVQNG